MVFLKQYGFFNTQKGTDTGAELSSFYSRKEYLKMLGVKGALSIHFESALNLTSQHTLSFQWKINPEWSHSIAHKKQQDFYTGLSKTACFSVVVTFSESVFLSIV